MILDLLRLHSVPGLGARTLRKILTWANDGSENLSDRLALLFESTDSELLKLFGLKSAVAEKLWATTIESAQDTADQLAEHGFSLIDEADPAYPESLRAAGDSAPPILYVSGAVDLFQKPAIAFSGSRSASEAGLRHTETLSSAAVARGLTVISGGAVGVDQTAHFSALAANGTTIIVLAEGALKSRLNAAAQEKIRAAADRVLIVTEFPPHAPWSAPNAMIRNGTILALAKALIVIEAGDSGGTLDAGRRALKQQQPIYVLAYPTPPPSAPGNAILISEGAHPLPTEPTPILPDLSDNPVSAPLDRKSGQLSLF